MTVQSLSYLLFVVIVWTAITRVRPLIGRQALLLLASYLFYATWGLVFVALLSASSLMNFALARYIRAHPTTQRLWIGVLPNLLVLFTFKYLPAISAGTVWGGPLAGFIQRVGIPVGISFWTFQALSYLFDTYREERVSPSLLEFCLYLSFWPTVLSGPISRMGEMLDQFRGDMKATWVDLSEGCRRILVGLFMKLFVAQVLMKGLLPGQGLDSGFDQLSRNWGGIDVWVLAIGYGFQLFFDFAGYSHIVIGSAQLFGIHLPENFKDPYISSTPSIFWTRWHMSLSFWIRDYLFLPLATLRKVSYWKHFALLISMTIFGLWHGATGGFVCWGLYQGVLLVGHRQVQGLRKRLGTTAASGFSIVGLSLIHI